MASSGNFCTLNPLAQLGGSTAASTRAGGMSAGNLKYVNITGNTAVGNFGVTSGKWYYEVYVSSFNSDNGVTIGWSNDLFNLDAELGYNSPGSQTGAQAFGLYGQNQKLIYGPGDGGGTYNKSYGSGTPSDGDIMRIWLDADNGKFWAGLNGTIYGSGDPSAGTGHGFGTGGSPHNVTISSRTLYPAIGNWSAADGTFIFNFGQDSTFQGAVTAGTNTDGNGFGSFKYDPDGFLALCSANLPTGSGIDPAETNDNYPAKQCGAVIFTGDGTSSNAITGLGFQPDLVWIKARDNDNSYSNAFFDTTRGRSKSIFADSTRDEDTSTSTQDLVSFDSDGFTVGTNNNTASNLDGKLHVAWGWRANGGTTATNTDGDITSTVQANTKAGFSIVSWTSNNQANQTVGHGLGAVPKFILTKPRYSGSWSWWIYHITEGTLGYYKFTSTKFTSGTTGYGAHPDSSVFTMGAVGSSMPNDTSTPVISYCWADIEGLQKFGTYEGNSDDDGTFVYTGFRPRMIFIKETDNNDDWVLYDTARNTFNYPDNMKVLRWDSNTVESSGAGRYLEILSNGFKFRTSNNTINHANTYTYGAWADVPFKYNNTF
jgi:hypothetical protein